MILYCSSLPNRIFSYLNQRRSRPRITAYALTILRIEPYENIQSIKKGLDDKS